MLATENPIEYEGTYPLPEAQLDRFQLKILLDYPNEDHEREVIARWNAGFNSKRLEASRYQPLPDPEAIFIAVQRLHERRWNQACNVTPLISSVAHARILSFITVRARARSVALLLCSKALAAIRGRDFVTPDDVRDVALPVLRHRLTLRAEAELDGVTPDSVITDILKSAEVPQIGTVHRLHRFGVICGRICSHLAFRFHKTLLLSRRTRVHSFVVVVAAAVVALGCACLRRPASRRRFAESRFCHLPKGLMISREFGGRFAMGAETEVRIHIQNASNRSVSLMVKDEYPPQMNLSGIARRPGSMLMRKLRPH